MRILCVWFPVARSDQYPCVTMGDNIWLATHMEPATDTAHLLGERPEQLKVVGLQAALAGKRLEHLLDLIHVLALVQVRSQQSAHYVPLHQPCHRLL